LALSAIHGFRPVHKGLKRLQKLQLL